ALVGALTLLVPLVTAMAGRPDPGVVPGRVPLGGDVRAHAQDTRLVAVRVEEGRAFPVGHDRPGSLRGAASAEAYAVVPPGWVGEDVELVCLPSWPSRDAWSWWSTTCASPGESTAGLPRPRSR